MPSYLDGYKKVLPQSERENIEQIIKENQELVNINTLSEQEFRDVINRLAETHKQLTMFIPQIDKLDDEAYNDFFSNVHVDLNLMFMEAQLIESATTNYDRIFSGIVSDLEKEVQSLRNRVNSLRLVSEGADGLIVKQYSFDDQSQMETDTNKYGHLFKDRDKNKTSMTNKVVKIERSYDQYFITLAKTEQIDCLHDNTGRTTAKIEVVERRGTPITLSNGSEYGIEKAIDGDKESYWGEVVVTKEPIQLDMKK
jgi:cobalamin biosynthesis Mg chelatase CobN